MNHRTTILTIFVLALLVSTFVLLRTRNLSPKENVVATHGTVEPPAPAVPVPPPVTPAPATNPQAQAVAEAEAAAPVGKFVPGHFPGVSVSHEPGSHRPTPPDGTPRTVPKEQEIILPDGRRLIGVTIDETWRVPLRLKTHP
ncbi:MAG: hypothetical protein ABIT37_22205 [Luteolibacter sp.]